MTKRKRYKRYSPEFKRVALKRASEERVTDVIVCEELGINARQLRRWRDEFRLLGDDAFPGQGHSRDEELTKLKRELAKVKQERDFLKDAAVSSTGHRNSGIEFIGRRFVFQCFSRSLIEPSSAVVAGR